MEGLSLTAPEKQQNLIVWDSCYWAFVSYESSVTQFLSTPLYSWRHSDCKVEVDIVSMDLNQVFPSPKSAHNTLKYNPGHPLTSDLNSIPRKVLRFYQWQ